jgi:hypothetical protein
MATFHIYLEEDIHILFNMFRTQTSAVLVCFLNLKLDRMFCRLFTPLVHNECMRCAECDAYRF